MEVLNTALKAVGVFSLCFLSVHLAGRLWNALRKKKRRKYRHHSGQVDLGVSAEKVPKKKAGKFEINKMDIILIIIAVTLFIFTWKMISLFEAHMAVPDTLITCVFGVCGGECGVMGWIKTSNERHRDRKWQLEDEERMEAK